MQEKPGVFAGIDWASVEHQVCLMGGGPPVQRTFAHDALGIGALVDAVGNDKNSLLFPGYFKDVLVGETVREIPRDCLNVVSEILKVRDKPEISALVE